MKVWGPPGTAELFDHVGRVYTWDIEIRRRMFDALEGSKLEAADHGPGVAWEQDGIRISAFEVTAEAQSHA